MDTRSLRLWSNYTLPIWGRIFISALILTLSCLVGQQARCAGADPVAFGSMSWNPKSSTVTGRVTFVFGLGGASPHSQGATSPEQGQDSGDEFWLLPNRDLNRDLNRELIDGSFRREQHEFRSTEPDVEWPFQESGLGALVVKRVAQGVVQAKRNPEGRNLCLSSAKEAYAQFQDVTLAPAVFELRQNERVLRVANAEESFKKHLSSSDKKSFLLTAGNCRLIRIDYVFYPRLGLGNFSRKNDGRAYFSGPIFPLWRNKPIETHLVFDSVDSFLSPQCANCSETDGKKTAVTFLGLPPPLHFLPQSSRELLKMNPLQSDPKNFDLEFSNDKERELRETVAIFSKIMDRSQKAALTKKLENWQVNISVALPIEQLIVEQWGEIQLHSSFGQVTPLLANYHRAALFRVLARSFARFLQSHEAQVNDWGQLRRNETLARIVAEIWLQEEFPRLSALRDLSDRFSFLPFFRAVQQGNAFVNNAVFVGAEENASQIDYGVIDDFFAPFSGASLLERVNHCLDVSEQKKIRQMAIAVFNLNENMRSFETFLSSLVPNSDCTVPMEQGLIPAWTPKENIEISELKSNRIVLKRSKIQASLTNQFFYLTADETPRDTLRVVVRDEEQRVFQADSAGSKKLDSETLLPTKGRSYEVQKPHRAVSADRLIYPRPFRTVLQALALNYDSRRSDVTLKTQLQTTQLGDDWGKAFVLGIRRENQQNHLDLQLSTGIPSLIKDVRTTISIASMSRLVRAPPSFLTVSYALDQGLNSPLYPDGFGLKIWLRRPLTLSALREKMSDPEQEWLLSVALPLASRLTWSESIGYGRSDAGIDAGLRSIPGWPADTFRSQEYALIRSEIRNTITQNLNVSVARSILFQHAVLYGAHTVAFDDVQAASRGVIGARSAQSVMAGLRFLGALFGAKDQALGFEVARALSARPRTSFGFTIGKTN